MRKYIFTILLGALAICACKKEPQVKVNAFFTTDKEEYGLSEDIMITNTTTVENSVIAICKWEWAGKVSYETQPSGINFTEEGNYPITLTVTANDGAVKGSYTKNITVIDNNVKPVCDFEWSPKTAKAGEPVTFTDKSHDPDGTIVAWKWTLGSAVSTEQNPVHTFVEYGQVEVSLTVTDNMKGTATKKATIQIEKGLYTLELLWGKSYEPAGEVSTRITSPAISPDGQSIYVTSTGGHLVSFDKSGNQKWSYDLKAKGVEYIGKKGVTTVPVVTPSVGADGTIYLAAGYDENSDDLGKNGIFAINPDGTQKWFADDGPQTRFGLQSPLVLDNYVATTQRYGGRSPYISNNQGCVVMNASDGSLKQTIYSTSGSWGGISAYGNMIFVNAAGSSTHVGGCQIGFPNEGGGWSLVNNSSTNNADNYWPGIGYRSNGCQNAVSHDGYFYFYSPEAVATGVKGRLACYAISGLTPSRTSAPVALWVATIPGVLNAGEGDDLGSVMGNGPVISANGIVYVTTNTTISAVGTDGKVLWTIEDSALIHGVAAVDKAGAIYYASSSGNLIKLLPSGQRVVALDLGATLCSSPTIAEDGTIYVLGVKEGCPTLFAVRSNDCNGPADNWSQLSGNPCKTSHVSAK